MHSLYEQRSQMARLVTSGFMAHIEEQMLRLGLGLNNLPYRIKGTHTVVLLVEALC
jgi:hypothetical protein